MCIKARAAEIRAQVLALVLAAPDGISREALRAAVGCSFNSSMTAALALRAEGLIELTERGSLGVYATPERCAAIRARQAVERAAHRRRYQDAQNEIARQKRAAARRKVREQRAEIAPRPGLAVRIKSPPPAPMSIFNLARLSQHESTECLTS